MEIKYNNDETVSFDITGLSWINTNRIYIALKKISDLIGKTQFPDEYCKQEAARLKEKYIEIIRVFDNCKVFSKGEMQGIDEDILKFL